MAQTPIASHRPFTVDEVVRQFTADLESAIRHQINSRVEAALARMEGQAPSLAASPVPARLVVVPQQPTTERRARLCRTPGCSNPAAGPKYGWYCREHGAAYRAGATAATPPASPPPARAAALAHPPLVVTLPMPKTATVIPEGVTIKRLPPGPAPRAEKRAGPPTNCRLPGCMMKNSGPRYDFFCRDHYAQLNKEDRQRYADLWRAQRAPTT
jgi:hypothetical protein